MWDAMTTMGRGILGRNVNITSEHVLTASSTAISSKGFMLCFTPSVTTPSLSGRTLHSK
jgi:hypothetical protein